MSTGCGWVQERLIQFLGGELDPDESSAVDEHVKACESCARELKEFKDLSLLLEDDGYREPSSFFWTRFNGEVMGKVRAGRGRTAFGYAWPELVPKLAPAVIAIVCFGLGLWMGLAPFLSARDATSTSPDLAELTSVAGEPLISESSKLVVASGQPYRAGYGAADTLWPDALGTVDREPHMALTSDDEATRRLGEIQRLLESYLARE